MRLVSRDRLIATVVAISAIATPCAQAMPAGGAFPSAAQQKAQSVLAHPRPSSVNAPSAVRPNADEQLPASSAATVAPNPDQQLRASAPLTTASEKPVIASVRARAHHASTPLVIASPRGFEYGDAAIGAGVMTGLALLGTAGIRAIRRRGQLRHQ